MEGSWREWNQGRNRAQYFDFLRRLMETPWGKKHWRVPALVDESGRAAAAMSLYDVFLRLEGKKLRLGGVGSFTVAPELRKRGLGRRLMDEVHAWLSAEGYDGAVLFSAIGPGYYARMGYEHLPTQSLEADVGRHWTPERVSSTPPALRDFRREDLSAVMSLYNMAASAQRMALLRDEEYWDIELLREGLSRERFCAYPHPRPFLVGEREGRIASYMRSARSLKDGALVVLEYAFEAGAKEDVAAMLALVRESLGPEAPAVLRGLLPSRFANLCPSRSLKWSEDRDSIMMIKSFGGFRVPVEAPPDERFVWSPDWF